MAETIRVIQAPRKAFQSRFLAIMLAIFLGGFGVHRMYLGQTWLLRLLIAFTVIGFLLTSLLGLIDALGLIFMTRATFDRRYGH